MLYLSTIKSREIISYSEHYNNAERQNIPVCRDHDNGHIFINSPPAFNEGISKLCWDLA